MMKPFVFLLLTLFATFATAQVIKTFHPNGMIASATTYKDGKKNGVEHIFYPDGATLRYSHNYVNGKRHGLQQEYSQDALLIQEESYKEGKLDGRSRRYQNGLLTSEADFEGGLPNGSYREFFPSGLIKMEAFWENGRVTEGYLYIEEGSKIPLSAKALQILESDTQQKRLSK